MRFDLFRLKSLRLFVFTVLFLFSFQLIQAKIPAPLPDTAYDGGVISAETLGRGGTIASNRGTPASGSENPASLGSGFATSLYTTIMLNPAGSVPDDTVDNNDPLENKTLQYLSMASEKGVLFYEPIARRHQTEITDEASPTTDFRTVDFSANALGFAGVNTFGKGGAGQVGLSLAYLWSSLTTDEHFASQPQVVTSDTMEGFRMNLGVRYPAGPTMVGISLLNAPAFLWGKKYDRQMLPFRVRMGTTWKLNTGLLLSGDVERRYYNEGGNKEDFAYVGTEWFASKNLVFRAGVNGTDIGKPEERHVTAGTSIITKSNGTISYAYEKYELDNEIVKRSVLSFQIPFAAGAE